VVVGDPRDSATTMGPLVSKLQFDKVQRLIQAGIDEGATLVCGGVGRPAGLNRGWFVQPTIFGDVVNDDDHLARGNLRPGAGDPAL
jgi:aldehyde dehydrogenase (NAD+)